MLSSFVTRLGFFLLFFALTGCSQYIESQPYMTGTFIGFYQTDDKAVPIGLRIETKVTEVTKTRYTFSGSATLGAETYNVEGYELANPNLGYLSAQALPQMGILALTLTDPNGTLHYSLCSDVFYGDRLDTAYTFEYASLFENECDPYEYKGQTPFAFVELEKVRP